MDSEAGKEGSKNMKGIGVTLVGFKIVLGRGSENGVLEIENLEVIS